MRLAIVLHATSSPGAREDGRALAACLRSPAAGFEVLELPAYEDAATLLPRALERVRASSVVVVAVLARLVHDAGGIGIVGGARSLSLAEIAAGLSATGADAVLVVDGVVGEGEMPADMLAPIARALSRERTGLAALVGLRSLPTSRAGLVRVLVETLGESPFCEGVVQFSALLEALREREDLPLAVSAMWFSEGSRDPLLLAPRTPGSDHDRSKGSEDRDRRALSSSGLSLAERAGALVRMARAHLASGDAIEASFHLEKALSLDHTHREALEASLSLAAREARWNDVRSLGSRLLAVLDSREDRFAALLELARIWQDEARDEVRAAGALEEALSLSPRLPEVHQRLIAIYDRARRFEDLTNVLQAYASLAKSPRERASRLSAAAQIAGAALADRPRALALYDEALLLCPADPELVRARRDLAESALAAVDRDAD